MYSGIYILDSAEPFGLTASHRDLGEQSAGLALYFDTITHFAILMLCMMVACGLYPLIDAHANSQLDYNYEVRQIVADASQQPLTMACERQASNSAILGISHGSRCNDKITASYYSCPTFCDFTVEDNASSSSSDVDFCTAHLPCSLSSLNAVEKASCCVETLQESLEKDGPIGVYALQMVSMLVILVWLVNFHKQQLVTAQQINARSVTVGDYAVFVTGLGTNEFSRQDLARFMSHYGEVASVVFTKNIGTLLSAEQDLAKSRLLLHELRAWHGESPALAGRGFLNRLFRLAHLGGADPTSDAHLVGHTRVSISLAPHRSLVHDAALCCVSSALAFPFFVSLHAVVSLRTPRANLPAFFFFIFIFLVSILVLVVSHSTILKPPRRRACATRGASRNDT